jgi:ferrochelatase
MRRYLNEFLSDKRVIDYSPWIWQPLLQLVILTKRPFSSGEAYKSIWNEDKGESPLMTITKDQTAKMKAPNGRAPMATGRGRFLHALRQPVDQVQGAMNWSRRAARRSCSSRFTRNTPARPRPPPATVLPRADGTKVAADRPHGGALFRASALYRGARAIVERAYAEMETGPMSSWLSYHGVPKRYLMEGDPYHCQCQKTTRL